ncbi:hypothetical protein RIB2604_00603930 [Aspergillus luchuensis]|uniref:Uncharacterized protein n=1 Tax=Aspergillus kawachii TaxID=1069201 RepID=A0A146F240_ASPKA|nr:hypothetical protein RIB2604_00603930 [Aspergillus luchuensis]
MRVVTRDDVDVSQAGLQVEQRAWPLQLVQRPSLSDGLFMLLQRQHTHQPAIEGLTAAWTMVVLAFWTWLVMVARLGNGNKIFRLRLGRSGDETARDKTTSQAQNQLRVERVCGVLQGP